MSDSCQMPLDDGFSTDYAIYADTLDLTALLAQATPVSDHRVWRVGEATEFGHAQSSGISIEVFPGGSLGGLYAAVREFLRREEMFLNVAKGFVRDNVECSLTTSLEVLQGHLPVHLGLPAALLKDLGDRNIGWTVIGFPCSEDGGIAVGQPPSNNEMQRTKPAQATELRR
jgi:hypothetical protein